MSGRYCNFSVVRLGGKCAASASGASSGVATISNSTKSCKQEPGFSEIHGNKTALANGPKHTSTIVMASRHSMFMSHARLNSSPPDAANLAESRRIEMGFASSARL